MSRQNSEMEFEDIQGIFRFAHGHLEEACFTLLCIKDCAEAKRWIAAAPVTSAAAVSPVPTSAMQIAFTASGLQSLEMDPHILAGFSEEFTCGMTAGNRPRRLGDIGDNAPSSWGWGGNAESCADVLLMLYANRGQLTDWEAQICTEPFLRAFNVLTKLESRADMRQEPFGFVDGISQPKVDWQRKQSTNQHDRASYSNLLAIGEILLGYPNEYGEYTDRPLLPEDTAEAKSLPFAEESPRLRDLGRNGGYLVFRQLQQDVPGFWQFLDNEARGDPARREQLAEAMVGRRRDGRPLMPVSNTVSPENHSGQHSNNFNYDNDPAGKVCPVGAHIRRTNPRTGDLPPGFGFLTRILQTFGLHRKSRSRDLVASTRFHRLLRRGRPYGPSLSPEQALTVKQDSNIRGLNFVALTANISRQFEFVQSAWIASSKFGGVQNETDPLLGNRRPLLGGTRTDGFSMPQKSGPCSRVRGLPQFVSVQGGGYFFVPGLRALRFIVGDGSERQKTE
ncbi:MAG: Dyp-type peroxidase [bacterium]